VNKFYFVMLALLLFGVAVFACSKSQNSPRTGSTSAAAANLPIPLAKLPSIPVAVGDVAAGATVFAANCANCHGAGGVDGPGPDLAGASLEAGQVAYMVTNPQGVDKGSGMPELSLTDKQVADVAAYVASLK
jgi:mono/diheme cytochrome c family protein